MSLQPTSSQTVGPYFSLGMDGLNRNRIEPVVATPMVLVRGRVFDGSGALVNDAVLEFWQAQPDGHFDPAESRGFARVPTDAAGCFELHTFIPGSTAFPDGRPQAPHILVLVFCRGLLHHLMTRIYFADHLSANAADPVLSTIPQDRRHTLIARAVSDGYEWDVRLQGADETVFFDA